MQLSTVPGQPGHLAEVLEACFPSTPPVENSEPSGASEGKDGQGVCTDENVNPCGSINRDKTGTRYVKKGVTADYSGLRVRVQKVRCGVAFCETFFNHQAVIVDCSKLRVVAS